MQLHCGISVNRRNSEEFSMTVCGIVQHPQPPPGLSWRGDKTTSFYSLKNKLFFHGKRALEFHWKTFHPKPIGFRSLEHYRSPWEVGIPHLLASSTRTTTLCSVQGTGCSQTQTQHGLECAKFEVPPIVKLSPCKLPTTLKF